MTKKKKKTFSKKNKMANMWVGSSKKMKMFKFTHSKPSRLNHFTYKGSQHKSILSIYQLVKGNIHTTFMFTVWQKLMKSLKNVHTF